MNHVTEVQFSKLELVLRKQGRGFKFANLEFAVRDVSVYVRLDAPSGHFYYGTADIPAGQQDIRLIHARICQGQSGKTSAEVGAQS